MASHTHPLGFPATAPRRAVARPPTGRFWVLQMVVWPLYGVALMVPWLGIFTVAEMLPTKIVIAGTGMLLSATLREAYRSLEGRRLDPRTVAAAVVAMSLAAGLLWNVVLHLLLGGSVGHQLAPLRGLTDGVPQLAGGVYHGVILLAWSLGTLALGHSGADEHQEAVRTPPTASGQVLFRDGKRSVVVNHGEIDWIQAKGDYVRIHTTLGRLLVRATMASLEKTLPSESFARIHRSAIIRLGSVRETVAQPNREYVVLLRDGARLKVSRTYAGRFQEALRASRPEWIGR